MPKIRLRGEPGTLQFETAYAAAVKLAKNGRPVSPGEKSMIYFFRAGQRVKIGVSANLPKRLAALKTGAPGKSELIYTTPGNRVLEYQLHVQFREDQINGEWFVLSRDIVAWIAADEARRIEAKKARYGNARVPRIDREPESGALSQEIMQ